MEVGCARQGATPEVHTPFNGQIVELGTNLKIYWKSIVPTGCRLREGVLLVHPGFSHACLSHQVSALLG